MTELNADDNLQSRDHNIKTSILQSPSHPNTFQSSGIEDSTDGDIEDEELRRLLVPKIEDLPLTPPTAIQSNFITYYAPVGLASTHVAFKDEGGITGVDFNVGKADRSGIKVTGKRKKNAQHFESNTALCRVITKDSSYIVRCCVKGSLLEVNERLMKQPGLLNSSADREGYIAIFMPKLVDWRKVEASFVGVEEYKRLRGIS
ncbi:uncharacterized protein [Coffea arabica]|uniref:Uncharacterized protein isoform X2 n=1 Tax=Coffea arabica TaxID=13443 RepID=A0ABM4VWX9_COFAR